MMQRDSTGLTTENKELKMRLQAMEQQAKLRDVFISLWFALREEVQRLKIQAGQMSAMNGNPFNRGLLPQSLPHQLWCPTDPTAPAATVYRCLSHPPTTKLSFTLEVNSFKLPSCT
ncbi:hypothetical protein V6N13_075639 [Hibiscus sabdariffa]|uniref:Uncharacterized protein n=1 Tax=Hibiscus sabdariffa TaxID=183260 RepID=A0ABR2UC36_9ROSI